MITTLVYLGLMCAPIALVARLGSADPATAETAERALRALGLRADGALRTGSQSADPVVRARCARVRAGIRTDALDRLVRTFDPKAEAPSDHPVWTRFQAVAGDTRASRALFARLIAHPKDGLARGSDNWLARLDAVEADPDAAGPQYRGALVNVAGRYRRGLGPDGDERSSLIYPGDTPDEVAYLLFLGSCAGSASGRPARPGAELDEFLLGESRIGNGLGLKLGLRGRERIVPEPKNNDGTAPLPFESDRVLAKLLAAWLPHRTDASALSRGFELAVSRGAGEVLPAARAVAADPARPAAARLAALPTLAQFGSVADLPLFVPLFDDNTFVPADPKEGTDLGPSEPRATVADVALGLALLLCDRDPFEYGFFRARGRLRRDDRPVLANYQTGHFGFVSAEDRAAAHAKAKPFLARQKTVPTNEGPKPRPGAAALVKQLAADTFAEREAAQRALQEPGAMAKAAVLDGLKSENPEVARRCAELLPGVRRAEWRAARAAFTRDPAGFDHPVWTMVKRVAGDGADARAVLADVLEDERTFVALDQVIDEPKAAARLYRQALVRLLYDLAEWNELRQSAGWQPDPGAYAGMLLLGSLPETGAEPAFPPDGPRRPGIREDVSPRAVFRSGIWDEQEKAASFKLTDRSFSALRVLNQLDSLLPKLKPLKDKELRRADFESEVAQLLTAHEQAKFFDVILSRAERVTPPPPAALQKVFAAWIGTRTNAEAVEAGFSMLRRAGGGEAVAVARALAGDATRPARTRAHALLYLATYGTADDAPLAAALFADATEVPTGVPNRVVQVRDIATVVGLRLHGLDESRFGFGVIDRRDDMDRQYLLFGFRDNDTRARALKEAQAKVHERIAARAAEHTAPAPRAKP